MSHLSENLQRLGRKASALAEAVRSAAGGVLSLTPSREGSVTAKYGDQWVHSAYDPRKEARIWGETQLKEWRSGEIGVVLGVGLLYHVETLAAMKTDDRRVAVVVADVSVLKDALAARPMGDWVEAVEWIWGDVVEMARCLSGLSAPLRFLTYVPGARLHADVHRELETALRRMVAEQGGGRLHIAVVGPIYGGSLPVARYVVSALESLGHGVTWIDHSSHRQSYDRFNSYQEARHRLAMQSRFAELLSFDTVTRLAENRPDLVLAIAQAPLTAGVLEHVRKKKFPTAMWFVENYRHLTYWRQLASSYDYWFVIQQGECVEAFRRAGARQVHYLPVAADADVHAPCVLTDAERAEYGADVSFVGAGYRNRRALLPRWLSREWTFKLWGDEWEGAAELAPVLQRGGARIDTETCRKVFNASTINLNIHSYDGPSLDPHADFVNPRTFELAGCGAFQLTDERTLLSDLFTEQEVVRFRREDEVPKLIRRWLHDHEARRAVAEAARRRVLAQHTYRHRMKELLAAIGVHQPDRIGAVLRGDRHARALASRPDAPPELSALLDRFPPTQRVELKDLAEDIRRRGVGRPLAREELLVLLLDSYRSETRDLV
ncbi:MAG: glycosyltransferase [Nitrospira sp.]|nr:glycosyltransferase [Nitrospira sp.]